MLALASQKLKASVAIEGAFTENGLSQFTDDTDFMAAIASSFANNEEIVVNTENFEQSKSHDDDDSIKDDGSRQEQAKIHFAPHTIAYDKETSEPSYNLLMIA